ncbi:Gfo/Idh/MocA family protein [Deinococcus yavapaiensis]|uniref:Putative dehydrogenase n=1 Tax=Deinococcus yavapaiensis KR-236 TaxID=694435 RepID=A0A318SPB1_9DEIO|nr:Gfo/Idh/MocA family oxidoreductase [Deinococcus yavapaiensis]PYE54590.1 putative dehydrogenase [Deinococcus yavapaiensis KR-236]
MNVGIVGMGNISPIYLKNARRFGLDVVAVADLDMERAKSRAAEYGVPKALSLQELLADDDVQVVLNLTIPKAHASVALAALKAGKHVYNEKPLGITLDEASELLREADARGLLVGCAPDTFLGAGLQACRRIIDEGTIGVPVAATAFMMSSGPERWHPDPAFFYQEGAGPMFDMGPYYLTALVNLFGGVRRVSGSARASFDTRTIGSGAKKGESIPVETPSHVASILDFASGPVATLVTSFDVWHANLPRIEIYGSEGTLSVPDPNTFGGPVRVRLAGDKEWQDVEVGGPLATNSRGVGLGDLALAAREGRAPRASGALAYHVLDVMASTLETSRQGRALELTSGVERPAPLPEGLFDEVGA